MNALRRFYEIGLKLKALEAEKALLREEIVATFGTGKRTVGSFELNVNSFTVQRFSRELAEAELGDLSRFEKPTATLRVDVKPTPSAILAVS